MTPTIYKTKPNVYKIKVLLTTMINALQNERNIMKLESDSSNRVELVSLCWTFKFKQTTTYIRIKYSTVWRN